jgi:hypothetical protein
MTRREDEEPAGLAEKVGEVARLEEQQAEEWWQAVADGDQSKLPAGAPQVSELRPLDRSEREDIVRAMFGEAALAPRAPRSKLRRTLIFGTGALAALAASVLLLVLQPGPSLPRYEMSFSGGERVERSADATPTLKILTTGSGFEVVLRPATPVKNEAYFTGVFSGAGPRQISWEPTVERSPDGALRARAVIGRDLELPPGDWSLTLRLHENREDATPAQTFELQLKVQPAIGDPR